MNLIMEEFVKQNMKRNKVKILKEIKKLFLLLETFRGAFDAFSSTHRPIKDT